MNLLIVEDEQNSREGLLRGIDWLKYGLLVKAVKNGLEAVELLDVFEPDIVITDIKMPKMNGIELAKVLKTKFKEIKIIFISGYDDKEYLMNAIRINIDSYLLKPFSLDELEDNIKRIVAELNKARSRRIIGIENKHKYKMGVSLLCDDFSRNLVDGKLTDIRVISIWMNKLDVPISTDSGCYATIMVKVDSIENTFNTNRYDDQRLVDFSIRNITEEIIAGYASGYVFRYSDDVYLCVVGFESEKHYYDCVGELSLKIKDGLARYSSITTTVSAGKCVSGITDLKRSFRQSKRNMQKGRAVVEEEPKNRLTEWGVPQELYEELEQAVKNGDYRASERLIIEISDILKDYGKSNATVGHMRSFTAYTVLTAIQQLRLEEETVKRVRALFEDFVESSSLDTSFRKVLEMINCVCNDLNANEGNNEKEIVERIKNLLESHYSEDISISRIARSVFLSSTYVCVLFKKHTGMTINEYLSYIRIERAKALLINTDHTVSEVALFVGYHDPKYFSRVFRRTVGVPPSEFFQK